MLGLYERFFFVLAAAVISYAAAYLSFRKTEAGYWAYVSVWLMELPIFLLAITGAERTVGFDIFIHTLGIPVMAGLLTIADILLIEIALLGSLRPLSFFLPKSFSRLFKIDSLINRLQDYHAIPRPERVQSVFLAAAMGGLIDFLVLFAASAFA